MSKETQRLAKKLAVSSAFSLVAGYTDVITLVRWHGLSTMMTGNLVLFGCSMLPTHPFVPHEKGYYLTLIATFFCGVVAYRIAEALLPNRGASRLGLVLAIVMLSVEAALCVRPLGAGDGHYMLAGLTPMFGMLTAACTTGKLGVPVNLMTGHLTTIGITLATACTRRSLTPAERVKALQSLFVVASTFAGAGLGAAMVTMRGEDTRGLLLLVAPLLLALLCCLDHLARPGALVDAEGAGGKARVEGGDAEGDDGSHREVDLEEGVAGEVGDGLGFCSLHSSGGLRPGGEVPRSQSAPAGVVARWSSE